MVEPEFTLTLIEYIDRKYKLWICYARYHSQKANVQIDIYTLLDEVQNMLFGLRTSRLAKLLYSKVGDYCELDFWVLRQIKNQILTS